MTTNKVAGVVKLFKPSAGREPNAVDFIRGGLIDLLINIPENTDNTELTDGYTLRRCAVDYGVALLTNVKTASLFVHSLSHGWSQRMPIKSWDEYLADSKIAW